MLVMLLVLEVSRCSVTRDNLVKKCNSLAIAMSVASCKLRLLGDSSKRDQITFLLKSINDKVAARKAAGPKL